MYDFWFEVEASLGVVSAISGDRIPPIHAGMTGEVVSGDLVETHHSRHPGRECRDLGPGMATEFTYRKNKNPDGTHAWSQGLLPLSVSARSADMFGFGCAAPSTAMEHPRRRSSEATPQTSQTCSY
uniref:Uncharacterized protein n=1 Tax=Candidatus Kentrum sp. TUN TaxID=2126343 RepID=A0A451AHJ4_9GAMM|nr:MAG: hypothetical protein BECKTUN1418F_GA0071002_107317 [Candidatus Kentron sp. TUN]VFK65511.1 MAG: hypothetical protein BECKTUN1418E_GA0071001_110812 [Candidatus Kentron sp. TUN]